ncbi:unnamed protein product [Aspergillus oryzae]|nr:unnamed protein product [Aspergillus oryzae]
MVFLELEQVRIIFPIVLEQDDQADGKFQVDDRGSIYLPDVRTSQVYRETQPQGVWRYRYSPEFPNLTPYDDAGAYHGAELPQVLGTYNATTATENPIVLSAFMQKTCTDFAKDPENGPGWPSLNEDSKLADFRNDENSQGITLIEAKDADKNCGIWFRESETYDLAW